MEDFNRYFRPYTVTIQYSTVMHLAHTATADQLVVDDETVHTQLAERLLAEVESVGVGVWVDAVLE